MARLNEPPQPSGESLDALKRRFIRQNRDLAKVNSTQSVRIRNLECEVSRLLGENVTLREETIKLQAEVERTTSKYVLEEVDSAKERLEAKLLELGNLVRGLGNVQQAAQVRHRQQRKSTNHSPPKRSPDQKIWKNALSFSEALGGAEGRLPPIVEDKYYPRRTLDADDFLGVIGDSANISDSPDLGPPPIAHFEEGDPIKFESRQDHLPIPDLSADDEEDHPKLSVNLETRKRRRESFHRRGEEFGISNHSSSKDSSSREAETTVQSLKSGAKRKLNVRDETEIETPDPRDDRDHDGKPSQRNAEPRKSEAMAHKAIERSSKLSNDKDTQPLIQRVSVGKEKGNAAHTAGPKNARKILGPKSVNSDPVNSPLKSSRADSKEKVAEGKDSLAKIIRERNRVKDKPHSKDSGSRKGSEAAATFDEVPKAVELLPKTPIVPPDNVFSPGSSEPSAARAETRDTPPPPDIAPDAGTGSFGRGSRRPKGSVNYAQPNLRDKMRRPTKELVDAVAAEERARQASIARAAKETDEETVIKQEPVTDSLPIWKTNAPNESHRKIEEPTSPLRDKTLVSLTGLPSNVVTERRRRTFVPATSNEMNVPPKTSSGAASAIAALTSNHHRSKQATENAIETATVEDEEEKLDSADRPSIYDFTGSSPVDGGINERDDTNVEGRVKTSRPSSRRHSTITTTSDQSKGTLSISRRGDRRRDHVLSGKLGEEPPPSLAQTKSVKDLGNGGGEEAMEPVLGRGERAASRRRSMML